MRIFDEEYNIHFGFINIHIVGNPVCLASLTLYPRGKGSETDHAGFLRMQYIHGIPIFN